MVIAKYENWTTNQHIAIFLRNVSIILYYILIFYIYVTRKIITLVVDSATAQAADVLSRCRPIHHILRSSQIKKVSLQRIFYTQNC